MANLFNYWRDQVLNAVPHLVAPTIPGTLYVALCSSLPTASQTGATIPELTSAGGYARTAATFGAASGGSSTNSGAVTFPTSTGAYSAAATHYAIVDSPTIGAGNGFFFNVLKGTSDVQTISTSGQLTAGTYTLTFGGQVTPAINFNDPATRILELLESLSTIGAGNVNVAFSGNQFNQATPGSLVITFQGSLDNASQAVLTITPTGITGGTLSIVHTTAGASGTVTVSGTNQTVSFAIGQLSVGLS